MPASSSPFLLSGCPSHWPSPSLSSSRHHRNQLKLARRWASDPPGYWGFNIHGTVWGAKSATRWIETRGVSPARAFQVPPAPSPAAVGSLLTRSPSREAPAGRPWLGPIFPEAEPRPLLLCEQLFSSGRRRAPVPVRVCNVFAGGPMWDREMREWGGGRPPGRCRKISGFSGLCLAAAEGGDAGPGALTSPLSLIKARAGQSLGGDRTPYCAGKETTQRREMAFADPVQCQPRPV